MSDQYTVLLYSNDAAVRDRIRLAIGPRPAADLRIEFVDATTWEECRRLLECLTSEELRTIAICKMEGYTNAEIAERLDCATTTVERKLQRIRAQWKAEIAP